MLLIQLARSAYIIKLYKTNKLCTTTTTTAKYINFNINKSKVCNHYEQYPQQLETNLKLIKDERWTQHRLLQHILLIL